MKVIAKIVAALAAVYGALFAIFWFDLDGKLLFYVVEPTLCKHYDKMERRDPMKPAYDINVPKYEYKD
ncbi:MAG: hypothetical protein KBS43_06195 [Oscillospiraceae bacterium]|nr:hypothetical protein [Candidatus Limimonas coprohippi]MCQ2461550.1 hypothetical protein [Clostridia bacterium]